MKRSGDLPLISWPLLEDLVPYSLIWDSNGVLLYMTQHLRKWWKVELRMPLSQVEIQIHRPFRGIIEQKFLKNLTNLNVVLSRRDLVSGHKNLVFKLRGQLHCLDRLWVYSGFPDVTSAAELSDMGLTLAELPHHYVVGDLVIALEISLEANRETRKRSEELEKMNKELQRLVNDFESSKLEVEGLTEGLRSSDDRYRALFDNAHDMIQSIDLEGNFSFVNPAWIKTMGYTLRELKGIKVFDLISPESQDH
ncbi:MAG TPA: PAS domain S-box protein, partial [Nitrospira sp.]|nr:PAS domain S-box protein [Candidatus Manganitrophaceae bacterium]